MRRVAEIAGPRAFAPMGFALYGALWFAGGCDRHPPADVSPPASIAAKAVAEVSLIRPADIVIEYSIQVPQLPRGRTVRYAIAVNNGSGFVLRPSGEHRAYIAYHWLPQDGQAQPAPGLRRPLQTPIAPGESAVAGFDVTAPDVPGQYILKVFMGVEGGPDFEVGGQAPLHYLVTVD